MYVCRQQTVSKSKEFFFWKALKSRDPTLERAHSGVQGNLNRPWVNDYNIPNRKKMRREGTGRASNSAFQQTTRSLGWRVWNLILLVSWVLSQYSFSVATWENSWLETTAVCGQTDDQIQTWDHWCIYSNILYERWECLHAGRHTSVWNPRVHAHHPCVCVSDIF